MIRKTNKPTGTDAETSTMPDQLIYCGPNLVGGRLMTYTVFRGGLPEYLKDVFESHPSVKELIVPIDQLASVQENIHRPGTLEHHYYQEARTFNEKGRK